MKVIDVFYKMATGFLICLQIFTSYVGFVAFFYASIQIIFSYFLALVTNCLSQDYFSLCSNLLWMIVAVPYIHIIIVMNFKIIYAFVINLGKTLNFAQAEKRLREFFQNPKWCDKSNRVDRWGFFYHFGVLMNLIFLIIEIATTDDQTVCSLAFAGLSSYPPLFGILFVLYKCIPLYRHNDQSSNFTEIAALSQSFTITENPDSIETNDKEIQGESLDQLPISSITTNKEKYTEPPNEVTKDKHQVSNWEVYFDPLQIIVQKEWIAFIKDPETNNYRYLTFNRKVIPSFCILAIFLEYLSYSIYQFVQLGEMRDNIDIIFFVYRIIYYLFSFRFLIVFNVINYIMNFKKIKERHNFIWLTYLAAIVFSLLLFIAFIIAIILIYTMFAPYQLSEFNYSPTYENISMSAQASICQLQFYDMNLIEYAGIASLGQSKNDKIASEILKMVFNREVDVKPLDNPISYSYSINFSDTYSARVFESLTDTTGLSFMLDLFINDFVINKVASGPIPFYFFAIDVFLYRYVYFLTNYLNRYLSLNLISNFAYFTNNIYTKYDQYYFANKTVVYVGHSIGGLIAKGIGSKRNLPSIAFETLEYHQSLFHMSVNSDTSVGFKSERSKIMNIFTPSQLFSDSEETSTINVILPEWKHIYQFTNAYETFCTIAAGCATDAKYDQFCNTVMGRESYLRLFTLWNRTRSDIIVDDMHDDL